MSVSTRERNMRRIFVIFALICFLLAVYLFIEAQRIEQQLGALKAETPAVERNPQVLKKQLRRTRVLIWAALGGGVLLAASAAATLWMKRTPEA